MDSNPLWIGFESQFQKMKKIEKWEKDSNPFVEDSNPFQTKTQNLHSKKKWHFYPCFEHFLASSISDKNEDKVQNLLKQLVPDYFKLIYYVKNRSKEAIRISFPESYRKPNVKDDSNPLSRDSNPYSRMSRKWIREGSNLNR